MNKTCVYLTLCATMFILTGCETVKGGMCGAAEGAKKDFHNIDENLNGKRNDDGTREPGNIQKADAWVQKNMW